MTDTRPPREIRWFEIAQIVSILVLGLATPGTDWFGFAFAAVFVLVLTVLISRRRTKWARWVLTASFGIGLASTIWLAPEVFGRRGSAVMIVQILLQGAGIALLFTRPASAWLRGRTLTPRG